MCEVKLDLGDEVTEEDQSLIDSYDHKAECYDKATLIFNYVSAFSMSVGLSLLMYYFSSTF